jgi:predicted nucleic acid-binding protein
MEQPEHLRTADDAPSEPRPRRWSSPVELWFSEDPWDREVLDNIDELAWRLSELRYGRPGAVALVGSFAMKKPPLGGAVVLADKSAIGRAEHPSVRQEVADAFNARQIVTCSVVTLEVMYSARDRDSIHRAALTAIRELARRGAGRHRVPVVDVLIAAAAQEAGVGVLHYDHHFDRLAEVLHFRSVWLAPAGSLS